MRKPFIRIWRKPGRSKQPFRMHEVGKNGRVIGPNESFSTHLAVHKNIQAKLELYQFNNPTGTGVPVKDYVSKEYYQLQFNGIMTNWRPLTKQELKANPANS